MSLWFSPSELATLPALPQRSEDVRLKAAREGWLYRKRAGRGGGFEYALESLPPATQAHLLMRAKQGDATEAPAKEGRHQQSPSWHDYERMPGKTREDALARLRALDSVQALMAQGVGKLEACAAVAPQLGCNPASLRRWFQRVRGAPRQNWELLLAHRFAGGTPPAACSQEAWDFFRDDYLRLERPAASACYQRLLRAAAAHGWMVPSQRTLERRLRDDVPHEMLVLRRHGLEALERVFPAQERDKRALHALEWVNADGHKFDLFVAWPDGSVGRPLGVVWQDVYSGMILAWRVGQSESAELVRLSLGDLVQKYGIPVHAVLDNGRAFFSKGITGGAPSRHRFKARDEDPNGVLTALGVEVHAALPYHGQSKPIERAFGTLAEGVTRGLAAAGAYTGNRPTAKPENYGSRAIPLADFLKLLEQEILLHNSQEGRRTPVCAGRLSYEQAFRASYATATIRKATAEQRRLWLLAVASVRPRKPSGMVHLWNNAYFADFLAHYMGEPLTVRYDPDHLHERVHVYTPDDRYLGAAECRHPVGFGDAEAGKLHARRKAEWLRSVKATSAAHTRYRSAQEQAKQLPEATAPEAPIPGAVALLFDMPRRAPIRMPNDESESAFERAVTMLEQRGRR